MGVLTVGESDLGHSGGVGWRGGLNVSDSVQGL